jgi:uncharacterized coiled-coil protein SlyX
MRNWIVMAVLVVLFFTGVASAFSVSSISIDPSGSLTPSTPVTVSFKIENSGVFPADRELQMFTDLDKPKWTYTIIVNGKENLRPVIGGRTLAISGFELNYGASDVMSVRVTLEGVAPLVTQTSTKTMIRVTEYDGNGKPIISTQVEKTALVINTGEVASSLAAADVDLQVYRTHIDEKAVIGIETSAAEAKYNEAKQKINSARSRPSTQYAEALTDLNAATAAIKEGEITLGRALAELTIVPTTVIPTIIPTTILTTILTQATPDPVLKLLEEQNKKIEEQNKKLENLNKTIEEQNKKLAEQNDTLTQLINFLKNMFGWK